MTANVANNIIKIGVIAGTPVDTQMGVDFILKKGFEAIGRPTAADPEEQNLLQFLSPDTLTKKVLRIIQDFENQNIFRTMIYCNSLSAAIDIGYIRNTQTRSLVITPLDIYKNLATRYKKIALWAANGQCLSAIEHIFYEQNPSIDIIGISMLPIVKAIEEGQSAASIIEQYDLVSLCVERFAANGLILGCTHLPYLQSELSKKISIPIIDPAEEMLKILVSDS